MMQMRGKRMYVSTNDICQNWQKLTAIIWLRHNNNNEEKHTALNNSTSISQHSNQGFYARRRKDDEINLCDSIVTLLFFHTFFPLYGNAMILCIEKWMDRWMGRT